MIVEDQKQKKKRSIHLAQAIIMSCYLAIGVFSVVFVLAIDNNNREDQLKAIVVLSYIMETLAFFFFAAAGFMSVHKLRN